MGSFSFVFADRPSKKYPNRKYANITPYDKVRILIPKEFGGGFIDTTYEDYGRFRADNNEVFDIYELIAVWNKDIKPPLAKQIALVGTENTSAKYGQKIIDRNTDINRIVGINIGCYDNQVDALPYPPKLVYPDDARTYEQVKQVSYGDPEQGFYHYSWSRYYKIRK